MRRHRQVTLALALGAPLLAAAPAAAQGPPVENTTQHIVNETSTDVDVHPCTGQAAELTIVESGVIHFAAFADSTVHFTGTLRGTFSADLLPADGTPDATGRFTTWFGGNGLLNEDGTAAGKAQTAFTINGRGTNADGSAFRFHQNGNTVFDPNGVPKVDVFHDRMTCP
jgi:hypothetical protein